MGEKIAICITTRNRPEAFDRCLREWMVMVPWTGNVNYFVVDDASDVPYCNPSYRFDTRVGIPRAKNKCLELAMDWGADHIFLADDDVYPIDRGALLPYLKTGQHHLCYTFTTGYEGMPGWSPGRHIGNGLTAHDLGCGCMMYFSRLAIEMVGGLDTAYGLGRYEHADLSRRIYNAGLTPHKFMDVVDSDKLFHSMDKAGEVVRSFDADERARLGELNDGYFWSQAGSVKFLDYR